MGDNIFSGVDTPVCSLYALSGLTQNSLVSSLLKSFFINYEHKDINILANFCKKGNNNLLKIFDMRETSH